ncbi:hypothetical protein PG994_002728 [Apiospora phragmitis]|uniref:glutathione transferase n=1 Tax=Apiospora phragmitis TaxID=2905665 RepID=A0ABR1W8R1_9PEZI
MTGNTMKPIRIWLTRKLTWRLPAPGPNPWKVVFVLEELGIPYEVKSIKFDHVKDKPLTDVNPNGRVPAIEDPSTDQTLWESGAIITYLVDQYDTEHALTYTGLADKHHLNQFVNLHPEKLPSAIDRYTKQVTRVLGVLEGWLDGKDWLVGDKMTYAVMVWVSWNERLDIANVRSWLGTIGFG